MGLAPIAQPALAGGIHEAWTPTVWTGLRALHACCMLAAHITRAPMLTPMHMITCDSEVALGVPGQQTFSELTQGPASLLTRWIDGEPGVADITNPGEPSVQA